MTHRFHRQRGKIIATTAIVVATFFIVSSLQALPASAATAKTLSWDLVDSGKHLDWDSNTAYKSHVTAASNIWNLQKPGIIRPDTATRVQDVFVSDYYERSNTAGVTSSRGTIKLNKYRMAGYAHAKRRNVVLHEIGHALGLAHNKKGDIMYANVSNTSIVSANDKASYNAAYRKY